MTKPEGSMKVLSGAPSVYVSCNETRLTPARLPLFFIGFSVLRLGTSAILCNGSRLRDRI